MNKKTKKIISLFTGLTLAVVMNVTADDSKTIDINSVKCVDRCVTVEGVAAENEYLTLRMIKENASVRDENAVFAVEETKTDNEGNFSISFIIPDERNGESTKGNYTMKFLSDSDKAADYPFEYSSAQERLDIMDDIQAATDKTGFVSLFTANNKTALLNVGVSSELVEADGALLEEAADLITKNNDLAEISQSDLSNITEECVKLAKINILDENSVSLCLAEINPDCKDKNFDKYDADEQAFISSVIYKNRKYDTPDAFDKICDFAAALNDVNTAKYAVMYDVLDTNKDILGINTADEYQDYRSLKDTTEADKFIVEALRANKKYDKNGLLEVLSNAVEAAEEGGSSGGGGGGGSAGSSVGGGSYEIPVNIAGIVSNGIFTDMAENHWAYSYVKELKAKNIINGYEDNSFRPSNKVTREECVKMMVEITGVLDAQAVCDFDDVENGKWFAPYIASAVKAGIIKGVNETNFGTGSYITREDVAVIVNRILKLNADFDISKIADSDKISDYAVSSVAALYKNGILSGDENGAFRPKDNITRAEIAKVIYMALEGNK